MADACATITGKRRLENKVSRKKIWRAKNDLEQLKHERLRVQKLQPQMQLGSGTPISSIVIITDPWTATDNRRFSLDYLGQCKLRWLLYR